MRSNYEAVVYISLALDVSTLSMLLVDFWSVRGAMIASINHWDATYDVTGKVSHAVVVTLLLPLNKHVEDINNCPFCYFTISFI